MKKIVYIWMVVTLLACAKQAPPVKLVEKETASLKNTKAQGYYQYLRGELATNKNFYADAISHFEKAAADNDALAIDYRIAVEHARHFHFDRALAMIEQVLAEDPDHFYAKLLRAKINAADGNIAQSRQDFAAVLQHPQLQDHPHEKVRTQLALVTLQIEAKDFAAAKTLLLDMQKQDPQNELAFYYLARVYAEQGELAKAKNMFERTIAINNQFVLAHKALVLMYEYDEQEQKRIATLEKIVKLQPSDIQVRTQLIHIYVQQKKFDQAKKYAEYFANRFEQNVAFCYELGLFYFQQKMFVSADQAFGQCAQLYPDDQQIKYYYGLSLFYVGKKTQSLATFSGVKPTSDFYEKSILARASILRKQMSHQEIVDMFESGINKKPKSAEIRLHYARYQIEEKNIDQATTILRKAIRKCRQTESLSMMLAEIYEKQKDYVAMEKVLRELLEVNPASSSALNFLGYSFADRNINLDEAEQKVVKALEIKPTDPYIQDSLAWVYYRQGNLSKALQLIETALQNQNHEGILWLHYGDILSALKRKKDAMQAYQKALEFSKDQYEQKSIQQKINLLISK